MLATCVVALMAPAAAAGAPVSLVQVGTFSRPVYVTAAPGDTTAFFVVEQGGAVRRVENGQVTTFFDLGAARLTTARGEAGLLSIAFAPDYATSRKLYAYYAGPDDAITIDELTASADGRTADLATRRTLLRIPHDRQPNHWGGQLQFGPDGFLYIGTGDGGAADDPSGNGQYTSGPVTETAGVNHDPRLGKLLRIDPRGGTPYAIPPGQPGFGTPELWAIGLRNPFRFSFDRQTGDLIVGDVGQGAVEEIDFAPAPRRGAGLNFGWDPWEGDQVHEGTPSRAGFTFPVITHTHSDGWCAITGGYVVRDATLPELAGQYVYGDYCSDELHAARLSAAGATDDHGLGLKVADLSSFGEDGCGRVYAASLQGAVYRLESGGGCVPSGGPAPATGSDRTAPRLSVAAGAGQRVVRTGRVSVRVRCDEQCTLRTGGRFSVTAAGRTSPAAAGRLAIHADRRVLAAGVRVRVDLRFSRATRRSVARALRAGRRVVAVLTLRATDGARNTRTRTVHVRVRR